MATFHKGSWFGLPDFGVTEKIGSLIGAPRTAQGGSNLIGSRQTPAQTTTLKPSVTQKSVTPSGQALGASTSRTTSYGGGGAAPMAVPQPQGMDMSSVMQQQPQQSSVDFDALINPALQELDNTLNSIQGQFGQTQSDIQARGVTNTAKATQEFDTAQKGLDTRKATDTQQAESAADEARRQYSEIQQGIQSRYGGTTGSGAFAGEVAGAQTLKNIGQIRQTLSQSISAIDSKKDELREVGRIALQEIQDNTQAEITRAKQQLENSLADIRRQKGELQGRKAELASQAMQFYQQSVQQVNANNAQFMQDLYVRQVEAENQLALAKQKATSAVSQIGNVDYNGIIQNAQPIVDAGGSYSQSLPGGIKVNFGKKEEDDLVTQINSAFGG